MVYLFGTQALRSCAGEVLVRSAGLEVWRGRMSGDSAPASPWCLSWSAGLGVSGGVGIEGRSAAGTAEPVALALVVAVEAFCFGDGLDHGRAGQQGPTGRRRLAPLPRISLIDDVPQAGCRVQRSTSHSCTGALRSQAYPSGLTLGSSAVGVAVPAVG